MHLNAGAVPTITRIGSVEIRSNGDVFRAAHQAALIKTMEDIGSIIEDNVKEFISEQWPPASAPFTEPHKRTGLLRSGIGHQTDESETGVRETIYSSRPGGDPDVPVYLEEGTDRMKQRPYMIPKRDEWAGKGGDEIANGLRGNMEI